jgi:hypothetical protein
MLDLLSITIKTSPEKSLPYQRLYLSNMCNVWIAVSEIF